MEVWDQKRGDVVLLGPKGRLDSTSADAFETKILEAIEPGGVPLVIDFSDLDYISSAGLRVLLMAAKRSKEISGKIALSSLRDHVREVFDISGFSSIFNIYTSAEEAVAALS